MGTEVLDVGKDGRGSEVVIQAAESLVSGRLVAFPTETVYGLAARADHADAVARLRQVKNRAPDKAFTIHLGRKSDAAKFVPKLDGLAERLIRRAWPGPLTLILSVTDVDATPISGEVGADSLSAMFYNNAVGLRCPADPIGGAILRATPCPVVAASANVAGHPAPRTAADVLRDLDGQIDLVVNAGPSRYSKPSTIVRIGHPGYEIVREGVLDAAAIARLATTRILFICTGNTCRSPMAEGIAKKILSERLKCSPSDLVKSGVVISSAGTAGGYGSAADHAVTAMSGRGIDISGHAPTLLTPDHVHQADFVFAMTLSHQRAAEELASTGENRVCLVMGDRDVADPIGGSLEEYEACARMIEEGVRARLEDITL